MPTYYRIYNYTNNQEIHNLLGALILIGMMILVLGILLFHFEMLVLGSGICVVSGLMNACCLEYERNYQIHRDHAQDSLEEPQDSS